VQASEPHLARNGYIVECAINLNARRQVRLSSDWFEAEIIATIYGDCAHRRTTINRQPCLSAVDKSAHHQMTLPRAHQWQRYETRVCSRVGDVRYSGQFGNQHHYSAGERQKCPPQPQLA